MGVSIKVPALAPTLRRHFLACEARRRLVPGAMCRSQHFPEPPLLCPSDGKYLKIQLARESGHPEPVIFNASAALSTIVKTCMFLTFPQNLHGTQQQASHGMTMTS